MEEEAFAMALLAQSDGPTAFQGGVPRVIELGGILRDKDSVLFLGSGGESALGAPQ